MVPSHKPSHNISAHITCTRCEKPGYYTSACPFLLTGRPQLFQQFFSDQQSRSNNILQGHLGAIIVDSRSSFNSVRDIELLQGPSVCSPFESYSNGEGLTYTVLGRMVMFPDLHAYQNDQYMVNIVSLDLL